MNGNFNGKFENLLINQLSGFKFYKFFNLNYCKFGSWLDPILFLKKNAHNKIICCQTQSISEAWYMFGYI